MKEPVIKLKNYINNIKKLDAPLIIIGTEDHTNILSRIIKFDKKKTFFIDINKNDHLIYKKNIHKLNKIKNHKIINENN